MHTSFFHIYSKNSYSNFNEKNILLTGQAWIRSELSGNEPIMLKLCSYVFFMVTKYIVKILIVYGDQTRCENLDCVWWPNTLWKSWLCMVTKHVVKILIVSIG